MSAITGIEWTDRTWNPTGGCDRVSPGCAHCYAKTQWDMRHKAHLAGKKMPMQYAQPFETLQMFDDRLLDPLSWREPKRVFVNSVSDLFHEDVPDAFIDKVFAVMALAERHTFQILTKRPDRMRAYVGGRNGHGSGVWYEAEKLVPSPPPRHWYHVGRSFTWPLPNVWLGTSVENQHFADERIPLLLQTPAAVRFISAEPLLAPVDLRCVRHDGMVEIDALGGTHGVYRPHGGSNAALDWVIVGGESGPGARPFDLAWGRSIVQQCKAAGVACFVKQVGAVPTTSCGQCGRTVGHVMSGWTDACGPTHAALIAESQRIRDRKGGDPAEWPEDLRVREFPEARA